jgi:DNA polymerase III sliding clamp (beta) subunit (PCNA family)
MNRQDLLGTLELASLALAEDDLIPIFKCFAFSGKTVTACNHTLTIVAPCHTEEAFCLHGPTLMGLLRASHAEDVTFELTVDDVIVKAGKSVFKLPWFPPEDFPWQAPEGKYDTKINVDADFIKGLENCLWSSSKDNTQTPLMGVHIKPARKLGLAMYSCDGDAVTRHLISGNATGSFDHLLPNAFCEVAVKLKKAFEIANSVLVTQKDWALLTLGTFKLYGRLIEISNPLDHEDLIKKSLKVAPQWAVKPSGLDHALSRARVVADQESAKTVLNVSGGKLGLHTSASMGVIDDTLPYGDKSYVDTTAYVSAALVQRCASLCTGMAIMDNCLAFRDGEKLFILVSNMG